MTNKSPAPGSQAVAEQPGTDSQGPQEATSQGQQGTASQTQPGAAARASFLPTRAS